MDRVKGAPPMKTLVWHGPGKFSLEDAPALKAILTDE